MPQLVSVEFQRVQTFLFAVPRLRDMIGANAMLGEALRVRLPAKAIEFGAGLPGSSSLPEWLLGSDPNDPLRTPHNGKALPLNDDPRWLYEHGILARDGGHFRALFPEPVPDGRDSASEFVAWANAWLSSEFPGLSFEISCTDFGHVEGRRRPRPAKRRPLPDLPVFQVCEDSGSAPASYEVATADHKRRVSRASQLRKEKGQLFFRGGTEDIVGLLRPALPQPVKPPSDLNELAAGGYLAVIHADGNAIGARYRRHLDSPLDDTKPAPQDASLWKEARGEVFYQRMRVSVRQAIVEAVKNIFGSAPEAFQLLMLGGDDVLLVCQARLALPFVVEYCKVLATKGGDERSARVGVGVGVMIAQPSLPFFRLHDGAEKLAASAKRLYRSQSRDSSDSFVDWQICTNSWFGDPIESRGRNDVVRYQVDQRIETLALSAKPYPVLGDGLDGLDGLLKAAKRLAPLEARMGKAARSQMRNLAATLRCGRIGAELAFRDLPEETRKSLEAEGFLGTPWTAGGDDRWVTRLRDLVELYEIPNLGTKG